MAKLLTVTLDDGTVLTPIWDKTGDYWELEYWVVDGDGFLNGQEAGSESDILAKVLVCQENPEIFVADKIMTRDPESRKNSRERQKTDREFLSLMASQFPEFSES